MELRNYIEKMPQNELLALIPSEVKKYLNRTVNKNGFYDYFEKNIDMLLEEKRFVELLITKVNENGKKTLSLDEIQFNQDKLTNDSKNKILKLLEIKFENKKQKVETSADVYVEKQFYDLLDYQYLIKEKVLNYISQKHEEQQPSNRLIIHMPTGTGKTKTSCHTITSLYVKLKNNGCIVWLAHTEELLEQAKKAFLSVWGVLGNRNINLYFNDVKTIVDSKAIYFLSYQKLISMYKNDKHIFEEFSKNVSICVCDEAHKCLARETRIALEELMLLYDETKTKTLIGLTATPGRKYRDSIVEGDNLDLAIMFDKHIFSINTNELVIFKNFFQTNTSNNEFSYKNIFEKDDKTIKYFQKIGVLANIKRYALSYEHENSDIDKIFEKSRKKDYTTNELARIGEDKKRNEKIIEMLKRLDSEGTPTIVFACSNKQGQLLSDVLTLGGIKNNCIFGDTKSYLRKKYLSDFEEGKYNILINNSILTTGFDSPRIKCVFITRPTNSIVLYSQMIGRGLRGKKMGGNEECLLIDLQDNINKFNDENFAFNYFSVYWR